MSQADEYSALANQNHKLNYVEFAARDLAATKAFFQQVFGWSFVDYGPEYMAFSDAGLEGGFYQADLTSDAATGGALLVLFSTDLEATLDAVSAAGAQIVKPIFDFPGGRRFHFKEPSGNEFAVWAAPEKKSVTLNSGSVKL